MEKGEKKIEKKETIFQGPRGLIATKLANFSSFYFTRNQLDLYHTVET